MTPLATLADLAARVEGGIAVEDEARATACLEDVSALVRQVARVTYLDELGAVTGLPEVTRAVVLHAAARALLNPAGSMSRESIGSYNYGRADSGAIASQGTAYGAYLTPAEKKTVRQAAGRQGVQSFDLVRGDSLPTLRDDHADDWIVYP